MKKQREQGNSGRGAGTGAGNREQQDARLLLRDWIKRLCESDADIKSHLSGKIDALCEKLERYIGEIELFNPAYGLVSYKQPGELVIRHILDSLAPLGILLREINNTKNSKRLAASPDAAPVSFADAGSGAGLPGIPLAAALPGAEFTLIERMERRADFLQNAAAILRLQNTRVEQDSIEHAAPGRFDIITFRAFRPLTPDILKALFRLLAPGGKLAAYKGRLEKINEELAPVKEWAGAWRALPCPVPFMREERHLLLIGNRE